SNVHPAPSDYITRHTDFDLKQGPLQTITNNMEIESSAPAKIARLELPKTHTVPNNENTELPFDVTIAEKAEESIIVNTKSPSKQKRVRLANVEPSGDDEECTGEEVVGKNIDLFNKTRKKIKLFLPTSSELSTTRHLPIISLLPSNDNNNSNMNIHSTPVSSSPSLITFSSTINPITTTTSTSLNLEWNLLNTHGSGLVNVGNS
ncbi:unnamed protein product, partial [Didymodactylos carnosus]